MPSRPSSQRSVVAKRLGSTTPRVLTPPLRELTPETSRGFECIEFAEEILDVTLLPWQKWLLIHALEVLEDGTYRFRKVIVLVARQNGKSTLMQVLSLWRMYADAAPLVIGTAQNLDVAEEQWAGAVEMAEAIPELAELIDHVDRTNGKKALRLVTKERYKVAAASRRGGRGLSGDLVILDELREHQSWDAWAAVTKTTNARAFAQVWAASNAGDAASIVLRHFRKMAHKSLGDPDGLNADPITGELPHVDEDEGDFGADALGIFEWSANPGCSIWDRDGWAQANPSMGYTGLSERVIAADAASDPEWTFRTEVLCQWFAGTVDGPFPVGAWSKGTDDASKIAKKNHVVACVDVSWDRSVAHIAFAGFRKDGVPHVEIVASRAGTDWVIPWLTSKDRTRKVDAVTWQKNGAPVSSLTEEFEKSELETVEWAGTDLARATGKFYDLVRQVVPEDDDVDAAPGPVGVFHRSQPILDVPANTAVTKPSGDAWLWDRAKSPTDIAPLVAATGAVWALLKDDQMTSAYADEDYDLMVV